MINLTMDLAVLIIAIAVGFFKGAQGQPFYMKLLPYFLLLVLCVEFTGQITQYYGMYNTMLYNISSTIQFIYYIYFFREAIYTKNKNIITQLLWIIPALCLVNIFFVQGRHVFHTYTFTTGCVVLICLGVVYFYSLFKNSEQIELLREPAFWISISIVFFYICSLSFVCILNYITHLPVATRITLKKILKLVNAFAYLFFIIAFLCRSKTTQKSLS